MPLYEYTCSKCGKSFEKIVSFSESDQMPACPNCGEQETRKKISAGAMIGSSKSGSSSGCAPSGGFT